MQWREAVDICCILAGLWGKYLFSHIFVMLRAAFVEYDDTSKETAWSIISSEIYKTTWRLRLVFRIQHDSVCNVMFFLRNFNSLYFVLDLLPRPFYLSLESDTTSTLTGFLPFSPIGHNNQGAIANLCYIFEKSTIVEKSNVQYTNKSGPIKIEPKIKGLMKRTKKTQITKKSFNK